MARLEASRNRSDRYRLEGRWTQEQLALVSVLIKEKKLLRQAVRRCEEAETRLEKIRNEPFARKRLGELTREIEREGMQPRHVRELREILEDFPEEEAAPLRKKLKAYETRRLLQLGRKHP
ncbi:hypothetical protein FKP32DRAFT_1617571 [Trametes sanguinea]|nr:hypothetical protein FKP32DRAFT_1617571 [Trametes sanguinea]